MMRPLGALKLDLDHPEEFRLNGRPHWRPGQIQAAALAYRQAGLSFLPIESDGSKRPRASFLPLVGEYIGFRRPEWRILQERLPSYVELTEWYRPRREPDVPGIAIIGGRISGNLEIIDFDNVDTFSEWQTLLLKVNPHLLRKLVWVRSPRPGVHGYYRCVEIGGNQKLARKLKVDAKTGRLKEVTLIETKGEGGYALAPPSPPECHPSGRSYVFLTNLDFTNIQTISLAQREMLLDTARSLDQAPPAATRPHPIRNSPIEPADLYNLRPGDVLNRTATWNEILEPHGWEFVWEDSQGVSHWRRPGKGLGTSATTGFGGRDLLFVFSANASPFEPQTGYSKFHAFALLEHGGSFTRAAKALKDKDGITVNQLPNLPARTIDDLYR